MSKFDGRYHKTIYWPAFLQTSVVSLRGLVTTHHAKKRVEERAAALGTLPTDMDVYPEEIHECTIKGGVCVALCFRKRFNDKRDAVYVVNPNERLILTVFFNERSDTHATLDKSLYTTEP